MSSSVGKNLFPIYRKYGKYGKIKNVPNHQPAYVCVWELNPYILWKNKSPSVAKIDQILFAKIRIYCTIPTTNIDPTKIQSWKVTCLQKWLMLRAYVSSYSKLPFLVGEIMRNLRLWTPPLSCFLLVRPPPLDGPRPAREAALERRPPAAVPRCGWGSGT